MKYIIIYGDPVDGFTFVGPFYCRDEAVNYAERDGDRFNVWCIAELNAPAEEN